MKNKYWAPRAMLLLFLTAGASAQPTPATLIYTDEQSSGVFDPRPITLPDGQETTVGEFRQATLEHVARAVSLQFNNTVSFRWEVNFNGVAGFDALTLGPVFVTRSEEPLEPYGLADIGDDYPVTLLSALNGRDVSSLDTDPHGTTRFTNGANLMTAIMQGSEQAQLVTIAYHELIHVYGFTHPDCLGNCVPARSLKNAHMSPFYWYLNKANALQPYESLGLDEREEAGTSGNRLLAGGTEKAPHTSAFSREHLTAGTWSDAGGDYVELYADPENGEWSGQAGSHLSFDVQPAQLMSSSAAYTQDMGVAAAMLCDAGWCRREGRVIDLVAQARVDENASTPTQTFIDITFDNPQNDVVAEVKAQIRLDATYTVANVTGDIAECEQSTGVIDCRFAMPALGSKTITLEVGELSDAGYNIAGEVYSTGYDVDRNGFNNILDASFIKKSTDGGDGDTGGGDGGSGGGNGGTGGDTGSEIESSGGSVSWLTLLLGLLLFRRR